MPPSDATLAGRIGFALCRVIVPLWVLTGAAFKLYERNPSNLPVIIREFARKQVSIDLLVLFRVLIGLELFAVLVMVFIPRLSRAMAAFMLSCFCLILIGEMIMNAQKCGCFGSLPVKPWHMLVIDGALLAGVVITWMLERARRPAIAAESSSVLWPSLAMVPLLVVTVGGSLAVPEPPATPQDEPEIAIVHNDGQAATVEQAPVPPADPQVNPRPMAVPSSWYIKTNAQQEFEGKKWRDIELFQMMRRWPKDLDQGRHYVVFYRRDCEHCEAMFLDHLLIPLDAPVAAVQIPHSKTELMPPSPWNMPATPCEMLELPLGCNWIITPPLAFTIENGTVICAVEGDGYEQCLGLR